MYYITIFALLTAYTLADGKHACNQLLMFFKCCCETSLPKLDHNWTFFSCRVIPKHNHICFLFLQSSLSTHSLQQWDLEVAQHTVSQGMEGSLQLEFGRVTATTSMGDYMLSKTYGNNSRHVNELLLHYCSCSLELLLLFFRLLSLVTEASVYFAYSTSYYSFGLSVCWQSMSTLITDASNTSALIPSGSSSATGPFGLLWPVTYLASPWRSSCMAMRPSSRSPGSTRTTFSRWCSSLTGAALCTRASLPASPLTCILATKMQSWSSSVGVSTEASLRSKPTGLSFQGMLITDEDER